MTAARSHNDPGQDAKEMPQPMSTYWPVKFDMSRMTTMFHRSCKDCFTLPVGLYFITLFTTACK
jgi:hypothetical protein